MKVNHRVLVIAGMFEPQSVTVAKVLLPLASLHQWRYRKRIESPEVPKD